MMTKTVHTYTTVNNSFSLFFIKLFNYMTTLIYVSGISWDRIKRIRKETYNLPLKKNK